MVTPPPGQPIPMLRYSFHEEILPNVQPKPAPVQLEVISSCTATRRVGQEADPHLVQPPFRQL